MTKYNKLSEEQKERKRENQRIYRKGLSEEQKEKKREYARKYRENLSEEKKQKIKEKDSLVVIFAII